jgi:23S rRNA (cytidine1920-2'-O)/16S rRNA (cytidine1409-2'-O)-methyltransferase
LDGRAFRPRFDRRASLSPVKLRLDKLMVDRGLVPSRERAQALILAGRVLVDEQKVEKAGANVAEDVPIRVLGGDLPYVSRGGLKLARALEHWQIDVTGKICLDVGASTGGFTDCLLQAGAAHVVAVDTGYGQMDARLRADSRVRLLEKTNARYLTAVSLWGREEPAPIALVVMDVSFISATLVLPSVIASVRRSSPSFELVLLVKPQFEVGREQVGKGGIVRDPEVQQSAATKVRRAVEELEGSDIEVIDSPILGTEGNREFLLHARF